MSGFATSYFHSMWPLCWHLNPAIHTVRFLRDVSPFLTTVLAYQAALFCPASGHLVQPLFAHVMALAERNFSQGFKSLEIVQGYCLLLHWQPLAKSSSRDRQWSWLTMALCVPISLTLCEEATDRCQQLRGHRDPARTAPRRGYLPPLRARHAPSG